MAGFVGVNISNFAFHTVMSRVLGPSSYGELGALLNVVAVLSVPVSALQAAVTQSVSGDCSAGSALRVTRQLGVFSLALVAMWAAAAPLAGGLLKVHDVAALALIGAWIPGAVLGAGFQGVLMARDDVGIVGWAQLAGLGLGRFAFALVLEPVFVGLDDALVATVAGTFVVALVVGWRLRDDLLSGSRGARGVQASDTIRSFSALGGATVLTSLDAWLARHYLAVQPAGLFVAAATLCRLTLLVPGAVILLLFPRMTRGCGRTPEARRYLGLCLLFGFALTACACGAFVAVPQQLMSLTFGSAYAGAGSIATTIALADGLIGMMTAFVYFQLARRSWASQVAWLGCVLLASLTALGEHSLVGLADAMLRGSALILFIATVLTIIGIMTDRRSSGVDTSVRIVHA